MRAAGPPQRRVRPAGPADADVLHAMVRELAAFEREPDAVASLPADVASALAGPSPLVRALVAEERVGEPGAPAEDRAEDGWAPVGMAVWFLTWSTWTGRHGIWLEDLYVRPSARRTGVATELLAALAQHAVAQGWRRLEWSVLDWNTGAQAAYAAAGARPHDGWATWRVDGAALEALAARAPSPDQDRTPATTTPGGPA